MSPRVGMRPTRALVPLAHRRRVLVASVSAGTGHVRAAEAVLEGLRIVDPWLQAIHTNVLEHANPQFRRFYEDGYSFLVNRAPAAWATLYRWSDRSHGVADRVINGVQRAQMRDFLALVGNCRPHRIVATHFLLPALLENLPAASRPPIDLVITDFDVHRLWIHPVVDRYFVGSELAARRLRGAGLTDRRIIVTGIPIHPIFARELESREARERLGVEGAEPLILLLAGGQGYGALDRAVSRLFSSPRPLRIVSIAGRNDALRKAVAALRPPPHIRLTSLGFVNNMHEWMAAADLVVTKPGGLTVSEALARGTALVMHSAIPGQEEKNANFVASEGAGVLAPDFRRLPDAVFDCLANPERLASLRCRAWALGKPHAALGVAQATCLSLPAE